MEKQNDCIFEDMKIEDIVKIISKLNNEIEDKTIAYRPLVFGCTGNDHIRDIAFIKFFGQEIWNSDGNERIFDEDKQEYEPLEDYLRREIREIVSAISLISNKSLIW